MTDRIEQDPACIRLPKAMDIASAARLTDELLAVRGRPITLDGSEVERLGALGLQVLLSARRTWRADKRDFAVVNPSAALSGDAALLGASLFDYTSGITPND